MVIRDQLDHKKRGSLKSIGIWRKQNNLSIQDLHKFNHLRGGKGPHNSQIHKLENDSLEPYLQVFKSLAGMMNEIANEENFIYVPDLRIRERLKQAKPYLTHDGRVATFIDFIEIFEGLQPVPSQYRTFGPTKITEEVASNISDFDRLVFNGYGTDELLDKKEAWSSLKPYLEKILDDKSLRKMQSVCAGQDDWTVKEINDFTKNGTSDSCVVSEALEEWTGKEMPDIHAVWQKGSKMKWSELCNTQ